MQNNEIDDGGLFFPGTRWQQVGTVSDHGFSDDDSPTYADVGYPGCTLRDWFAGQALPQIIMINERATAFRDDVTYATALKVTSQQAYALADAMIAARKGGA